jgi:hypothetical protein
VEVEEVRGVEGGGPRCGWQAVVGADAGEGAGDANGGAPVGAVGVVGESAEDGATSSAEAPIWAAAMCSAARMEVRWPREMRSAARARRAVRLGMSNTLPMGNALVKWR